MVDYTEEYLQGLSMTNLKKIGKEYKIPKYTTWKTKANAIIAIQEAVVVPEVPEPIVVNEEEVETPSVDTMTITVLKKLAKQMNIPNASKYKKATIGELRTLVKSQMNAEEITVAPVIDLDAIKFRIQNLLADLSALSVPQQRKLLEPLILHHESLVEEDEKEIVVEQPVIVEHIEPVVFEMDEEIPHENAVPDFIPAEEVDLDEIQEIVSNMHETEVGMDIDEELGVIQTNIEKCLLMI